MVAISIPIFTSQLEKSRESVDLANMRAAYAEVQAAGLTEAVEADVKAQETDKIKFKVEGSGATYKCTATITFVQSDKTKWSTASPSVGGVELATAPGDNCTITYDAATSKTTISIAKTTDPASGA